MDTEINEIEEPQVVVESLDLGESKGILLGWCITGHHGWELGVEVPWGYCPGATASGLTCSCRCHRGEDVERTATAILQGQNGRGWPSWDEEDE